MATRIFFDGREYASPEDMPEEARRAYREALGQLADSDGNGVPDVLEGGGGNVVGVVHSSITVNGRTLGGPDELPAPMRRLYEAAMADADRDGVPDVLQGADPQTGGGLRSEAVASLGASMAGRSPHRERTAATLDEVGSALDGFLRVLLALAAVGAVALGAVIVTNMDAGSRSQGGHFYVGVGVLVVLGVLFDRYLWLARRRR